MIDAAQGKSASRQRYPARIVMTDSWQEAGMADDRTLRSPQDRTRIAMSEDYEVAYWTDKFGVNREELQRAVDAVGNSAAAVEEHLKR